MVLAKAKGSVVRRSSSRLAIMDGVTSLQAESVEWGLRGVVVVLHAPRSWAKLPRSRSEWGEESSGRSMFLSPISHTHDLAESVESAELLLPGLARRVFRRVPVPEREYLLIRDLYLRCCPEAALLPYSRDGVLCSV